MFLFKDYMFVSQNFQEIAKHTEILIAISTVHSPVLCSFPKSYQFERGSVFGDLITLVSNEENVLKLKELISKIKGELNFSNQFCKNWGKK